MRRFRPILAVFRCHQDLHTLSAQISELWKRLFDTFVSMETEIQALIPCLLQHDAPNGSRFLYGPRPAAKLSPGYDAHRRNRG